MLLLNMELLRLTEDRIFFDMDEASIEHYLKGLFVPLELQMKDILNGKIKQWAFL